MATYAEFVQSDAYQSKSPGAALEVLIQNELNPAESLIGKTSGLNINEDFETLPVEESGNDGVDEIVQGRHQVTCSVPGFWSPAYGDNLPTRQDFIGKTWTIIKRIATPFPGAGTVVDVVTGAKLSSLANQTGARGLVTINMSFTAERRYNGKQWADISGT